MDLQEEYNAWCKEYNDYRFTFSLWKSVIKRIPPGTWQEMFEFNRYQRRMGPSTDDSTLDFKFPNC